jgi:hypothetical protein
MRRPAALCPIVLAARIPRTADSSLPLSTMRRLVAIIVVSLLGSCFPTSEQSTEVDLVQCHLSGQKCQVQNVPQGTLFCAPDGDVSMTATKCFNSAKQTASDACLSACRGLPWASCTVSDISLPSFNSPNHAYPVDTQAYNW